MSSYPLIQVVNDKDEPIGEATFDDVYNKGLIHRIIHIIVEDRAGKLLLQKRGKNVATTPLHWDFSVGGHVDAGEDYITAAKREMQEELGIKDFELKEIDYFRFDLSVDGYDLKRFAKVYAATISTETKLSPPVEEVAELKWFTLSEVRDMITGKELVTQDLRQAISKYYK